MFDWDDQELANIIWGEDSEVDDHIVPYPEGVEKKFRVEYGESGQKKLNIEGASSKADEQNISTSKTNKDGELDSNDLSTAGAVVGLPSNLPIFTSSKAEDNDIAKKPELDMVPDIHQNQYEDKQLGELVDNGWANIGNFEDLDRIFSDDDLEGHTGLGSTDELWPSSKDLIMSTVKSLPPALDSSWGALGTSSQQFEINSEYPQDEDLSLQSGYRKRDGLTSYAQQSLDGRSSPECYAAVSMGLFKEKMGLSLIGKTASDPYLATEKVATPNKSIDKENWSNNQQKRGRRTRKLIYPGLSQDMYTALSPPPVHVQQFCNQSAPSTVQSSPFLSQQRLSQESRSSPYQHFSNPYRTAQTYGDLASPYPAMGLLQPKDDEHQSVVSSSVVSSGNLISLKKPLQTNAKTLNMTPQEKIEKLRRRQQMRAMLAIQKQQQQLTHQASCDDHCLSHKSSQDNQVHHIERTGPELDRHLNALPCHNPGSLVNRDNSSTISVRVDDYSVEDTVLYQLQDIIAKLDMKIRVCIRDSLYRLAQSAMQRNYGSYTSSTNKSRTYEPEAAKEDISRHDRMQNLETETNHIDRVVAHLLFHQPFKLPVKPAETPESSTSTMVSADQEITAPGTMPVGFLSVSSENEYNPLPHGSNPPCPFMGRHQGLTSNDHQTNTTKDPNSNQKMVHL